MTDMTRPDRGHHGNVHHSESGSWRDAMATVIDWGKPDWGKPGTNVHHSRNGSWWDATDARDVS